MFDFSQESATIPGWLTRAEGEFLYESAKKIHSKYAIVEIGSWQGRSTICLAKGSKDGQSTRIFAIDPHTGSSEHYEIFGVKSIDTFQDFQRNIQKAEIADVVEPLRMTSEAAARDFHYPLEFIFVDGAHEYQLVKLDLKLWFPKLQNGGNIAFHDSWHFPGPNLVTAGILLFSSQIRTPRFIDTITVFEKVVKNSLLDRIRNIGFLFYRTFFGWIGFFRLKYKGSKLK
jgi:predicted O-methyltransferase YrrM